MTNESEETHSFRLCSLATVLFGANHSAVIVVHVQDSILGTLEIATAGVGASKQIFRTFTLEMHAPQDCFNLCK